MIERTYQAYDQGKRTWQLIRKVGLRSGLKALRTFPIVMPYMMVGRKRLEALYWLAREVNRAGVSGDLVECGTCNGGTAAVLAAAGLEGNDRRLWLFDSFQGLPPACDKDGDRAQTFTGKCLGTMDNVKEILKRVEAPMDRVQFVAGWFQETFPTVEIPRIALLHVDADWYESVLLTLRRFYGAVQPGGYVVFDDYGFWEGCKKAVDEFLSEMASPPPLVLIDSRGVYLKKPA